MTELNETAEPSGASGGSMANAHSARQDAEAKIIVDGIAEITRIASEPEWIPVTERLPPGDVRVLIWCGNFVDIATLNWKYGWMYDDYGSPEPTHWMPLPAPPTGDK